MNTLIVLVIILIILSGWNLFGYYDLKKFNRSYRELKDDRYYELKYKTEFITASVLVVIFVGGFFGYKLFEDADNLKASITNSANRQDSLDNRTDSLELVLESKKDTVTSLDNQIVVSVGKLKTLSDKIDIINNKSIVKQDIYIVDTIQFNSTDTCRFYYKDLKNIKGEKLPVFDKPPFLAIFPGGGYLFSIYKKNKDYFILLLRDGSFAGLNGQGDDSVKFFGIMVSQR